MQESTSGGSISDDLAAAESRDHASAGSALSEQLANLSCSPLRTTRLYCSIDNPSVPLISSRLSVLNLLDPHLSIDQLIDVSV